MTRRPEGFDLDAALREVSFTPRLRDVGPLLERLALDEDAAARDVERALLRVGVPAAREALARLGSAPLPLRGPLTRLVGRVAAACAGGEVLIAPLLALLDHDDEKVRRHAASGLAKVPSLHAPGPQREAAERALLELWRRDASGPLRRVLATALAKIGGAAALAHLAGVDAGADAELGRRVAEARLVLERRASRDDDGGEATDIDAAAAPAHPTLVRLRCRGGLSAILAEELRERGAAGAWRDVVEVAPDAATVSLVGPLSSLFAARTWSGLALVLPAASGPVTEAVTQALLSPAAQTLISTWGRGDRGRRYRLSWANGRRRADVFRVAREVAARRPELINDPTERAWEVVVFDGGGAVTVELRPRLADPRFAWRKGDVPAASHPTVAAALARVAGLRSDDVVWDPFAGSGSELIERARAGAFARLIGSDRDPVALEAARVNCAAAGLPDVELTVADALSFAPRGVTLILTNPPLGRRVLRDADLASLCDRFLDHAARVLLPGGRIVWLSPLGTRTADRARTLGLHVAVLQRVDLGGVHATLQRLEKPR